VADRGGQSPHGPHTARVGIGAGHDVSRPLQLVGLLALAALLIAVAALVAALLLIRQSSRTTSTLRRHRLAHHDAYGDADPKLDRRQVNLGPPRAGERRGAQRYQPPTGALPAARDDVRLYGDDPETNPAPPTQDMRAVRRVRHDPQA
jgi:HAMP domain-containing protein